MSQDENSTPRAAFEALEEVRPVIPSAWHGVLHQALMRLSELEKAAHVEHLSARDGPEDSEGHQVAEEVLEEAAHSACRAVAIPYRPIDAAAWGLTALQMLKDEGNLGIGTDEVADKAVWLARHATESAEKSFK